MKLDIFSRHHDHAPPPEKSTADKVVAEQKVTVIACLMGLVASIGGFMFGYASGQISGFFLMDDYAERFGEHHSDGTISFSASRQGSIVGLFCIGCLVGALIAGKLSDLIGRRLSISSCALFTCVGTVVEISSSTHWAQFAVGRCITGLGIGALSVVVPMYQSETSPALLRGVLVGSYQLFITLGIWFAEVVNFITESKHGSASWRIPNGLGFLWALILGAGIMFLPESPRYAFRHGREDEAQKTIARLAGLDLHAPSVDRDIDEIRAALDEEKSHAHHNFFEIFTAPRMAYRIMLGMVLQAGSQLSGANFFFYFGTTAFSSTGISNSYITQLILGSVNVACTFVGLWLLQRCGRRKALMIGFSWMTMCFLVYSFVGHFALDRNDPMATPAAGGVLVAFSCLFIAAFAMTVGTLLWGVVAELYPSQYRGPCLALATASNWFWNFMVSFFTRFITDAIDYLYGLVFAVCCAVLVLVVFFFLIESKDRSLEEIDAMYIQRVNPIGSGSKNALAKAQASGRADETSTPSHRASTGSDTAV